MSIKICEGCHRSFKPEIEDKVLTHLFYSEKQIDQHEFLRSEYPLDYSRDLTHPTQVLCATCIEAGVTFTIQWGKPEVKLPDGYSEIVRTKRLMPPM